jgi:hypothetical protein
MGIKALQVGKTFTHISIHDVRPAKIDGEGVDNSAHEDFKPTIWNCKVLDSRVLAILKDKSTKITIDPSKPDEEIGTQVNQNAYYFDVCSLGLDKPDDFLDDKGQPMPWPVGSRNIGGKSYPIATMEALGTIPDYIIQELAERIIAGNNLTADEGNASA